MLAAEYEKGWKAGRAATKVEYNDRLLRCNQRMCGKAFMDNTRVIVKDAHLYCSTYCALVG